MKSRCLNRERSMDARYIAIVDDDGCWIEPEPASQREAGEGWESADEFEDDTGTDADHSNPIFERFLPGDRDEPGDTVIEAKNRAHLWEILKELSRHFMDMSGAEQMCQGLHIELPCGRARDFMAFDDIPLLSEPCECGNEWVIYYREPWAR